MSGFSWVTLATNDSYSLGALVLAHSLKQNGTIHQISVLVTPGVTSAMRAKLASIFNVVQEVNILDSKDEANLRLLKRPELGITFTKLHCWRLTQFEKCVFLDADTLVLRNCDELFQREEFSAAPDVGWPDCFNSGVFVYRPSNETYEKLVQFALDKGSFDGGDQGLLNLYFSDWAHKDINKHLPFIYNMCSTACYSYLPAFKQFGTDVKIVHFISSTKPWLQYFDTETRQVQPSGDMQHLKTVLQCWWDIFCTLIHPNLTAEMSWSRPSKFSLNQTLDSNIPEPLSSQTVDYSNVWDPWEDYGCTQSQSEQYSETNNQTSYDFNSHNTNSHTDNVSPSTSFGQISEIISSIPEYFHFSSSDNSYTESSDFESHHPESQFVEASHTESYYSEASCTESQNEPYVNNQHIENSTISSIYSVDHIDSTDTNTESESPPPVNNLHVHTYSLHDDPLDHNPHQTPKIPVNIINDTTDPLPIDCEANIVAKEINLSLDDQLEDDGGLAGAFAQFTLGVPRSPTQDALEDHLRRQGWEVGNIDYMGRDSFDNIWSKICETISADLVISPESPAVEKTETPPKEASPEAAKSVEVPSKAEETKQVELVETQKEVLTKPEDVKQGEIVQAEKSEGGVCVKPTDVCTKPADVCTKPVDESKQDSVVEPLITTADVCTKLVETSDKLPEDSKPSPVVEAPKSEIDVCTKGAEVCTKPAEEVTQGKVADAAKTDICAKIAEACSLGAKVCAAVSVVGVKPAEESKPATVETPTPATEDQTTAPAEKESVKPIDIPTEVKSTESAEPPKISETPVTTEPSKIPQLESAECPKPVQPIELPATEIQKPVEDSQKTESPKPDTTESSKVAAEAPKLEEAVLVSPKTLEEGAKSAAEQIAVKLDEVKPIDTPTPAVETPKPAEETAKPAVETPKPTDETSKVTEEAPKPSEVLKPVEESAKPAESEKPVEVAVKPAEECKIPAEASAKSEVSKSEVPQKPDEQIVKPADVCAQSTECKKPQEGAKQVEVVPDTAKPSEEKTKDIVETSSPVEEKPKAVEEPSKPAEETTKLAEEVIKATKPQEVVESQKSPSDAAQVAEESKAQTCADTKAPPKETKLDSDSQKAVTECPKQAAGECPKEQKCGKQECPKQAAGECAKGQKCGKQECPKPECPMKEAVPSAETQKCTPKEEGKGEISSVPKTPEVIEATPPTSPAVIEKPEEKALSVEQVVPETPPPSPSTAAEQQAPTPPPRKCGTKKGKGKK